MASFVLDPASSGGTSNLSHLLSDELLTQLSAVHPNAIEKAFGPGDDSYWEPERGYDYPEWYWQSSDGCVWGLGWRWGCIRLRGRGGNRINGLTFDRPSPDSAAEFAKFILSSVEAK